MKNRNWIDLGILATVLLTGCDGNSAQSPGAPAKAEAKAEAAESRAQDKAAVDRRIAADAHDESVRRADLAKAEADAKIKSDLAAAAEAKADADARIAADKQAADDARQIAEAAEKTESLATDKVNRLLDELMDQIKGNDLKKATDTMKQIDAMKGPMPQALRDRIEAARASLKSLQAGADFK